MKSERFLEALRASLSGQELSWEQLTIDEWLDLVELAGRQQMLPRIYPVMRKNRAARQTADAFFVPFEKQYQKAAEERERRMTGLRTVLKNLREAGVPCVLMEGPSVQEIFGDCSIGSAEKDVLQIPASKTESVVACVQSAGMGRYMAIQNPENLPQDAVTAMIGDIPVKVQNPVSYLKKLFKKAKGAFLEGRMDLTMVCHIVMAASCEACGIRGEEMLAYLQEERMTSMAVAMFRIAEKDLGLGIPVWMRPLMAQECQVDENPMLESLLQLQMTEEVDFGHMDESRKGRAAGAVKSAICNMLHIRMVEDDRWEMKKNWLQEQWSSWNQTERTKIAQIYGLV